MPFDYMHTDIPKAVLQTGEKAAASFRSEARERAAMLRRLGFSSGEALQRLTTNAAWDWEVGTKPALIEDLTGELEQIVAQVYAR